MMDAEQNKSNGEAKDASLTSPPDELPKSGASHTYLYAAAVAAFGILAGVAIAAISLHQSRSTLAPTPIADEQPGLSHALNDLGPAVSDNEGLKGHLTTQWDEKPVYQVTIEPGDATMTPGFDLSVSDPLRPLSINIQLKDRLGYVMCSRQVLLKYPVRKPAGLEEADRGSTSGKKPALKKISAREEERRTAEQADFDRKQAQELAREQGRDIFQNQLGQDGKVISISAQGDIPCPVESYRRVAGWGFVPDFPAVEEQDEQLGLRPEAIQAAQRAAARQARSRMAYNSPSKTFSFALEGDDTVVDFNVSEGIIQTKAGKTFEVDKTGGEGNSAVWQEYPAYFHYRCEQTTSSCTLARAGASVMHAKLKR